LAFFALRGGRAVLTEATGTCLQNAHFGPINTSDCFEPGRWGDMGGVVWPTAVWQIATVLACLSAAVVGAAGVEALRSALRRRADAAAQVEAGLFVTGVSGGAVMLLLMGFHFDRYWLTASIPLAGWAAVRLSRQRISRSAWTFGMIAVSAFAALDATFLHDWRAFNSCRWELVEEYRREGLATRRIDGGYEVNGWFRAAEDPDTRKRPGEERIVWWSGDAVRAIAVGPRAGWEIDRTRTWRSWAVGRDIPMYGLRKRAD
jgi:hypothetical protein